VDEITKGWPMRSANVDEPSMANWIRQEFNKHNIRREFHHTFFVNSFDQFTRGVLIVPLKRRVLMHFKTILKAWHTEYKVIVKLPDGYGKMEGLTVDEFEKFSEMSPYLNGSLFSWDGRLKTSGALYSFINERPPTITSVNDRWNVEFINGFSSPLTRRLMKFCDDLAPYQGRYVKRIPTTPKYDQNLLPESESEGSESESQSRNGIVSQSRNGIESQSKNAIEIQESNVQPGKELGLALNSEELYIPEYIRKRMNIEGQVRHAFNKILWSDSEKVEELPKFSRKKRTERDYNDLSTSLIPFKVQREVPKDRKTLKILTLSKAGKLRREMMRKEEQGIRTRPFKGLLKGLNGLDEYLEKDIEDELIQKELKLPISLMDFSDFIRLGFLFQHQDGLATRMLYKRYDLIPRYNFEAIDPYHRNAIEIKKNMLLECSFQKEEEELAVMNFELGGVNAKRKLALYNVTIKGNIRHSMRVLFEAAGCSVYGEPYYNNHKIENYFGLQMKTLTMPNFLKDLLKLKEKDVAMHTKSSKKHLIRAVKPVIAEDPPTADGVKIEIADDKIMIDLEYDHPIWSKFNL
jgi:hypothetical protein